MQREFSQDNPSSRYSPARLLLFAEAYAILAVARFCLLWIPFRRTAYLFGLHVAGQELTEDEMPPPEIATRIGRAVAAAAGRTPWESKCLAQALACGWMLRRRRIAGFVYLGLRRSDKGEENMLAHAWLRAGNAILTGARGHQYYTVVARFRLHTPA